MTTSIIYILFPIVTAILPLLDLPPISANIIFPLCLTLIISFNFTVLLTFWHNKWFIYARPLIIGELTPIYKDGVPTHLVRKEK